MKRLEAWAFRHAGVLLPIGLGLVVAGGMAGVVLQGDAVWQVHP